MIPIVEDLKSSPLKHRFGDVFNPPGLTNFLGCVQTDIDVTTIRSLNFPPFAYSDIPSFGLFFDRRFFPSMAEPVTFTWYPDRVERVARYDVFELRSTTVLPFGHMAAIVLLEITNQGQDSRRVEVRFGLRGGITKAVRPWTDALPPAEYSHRITIDKGLGAVVFEALESEAVGIQGAYPRPDRITPGSIEYTLDIEAGATSVIELISTIGPTVAEAASTFESLAGNGREVVEATTREWNRELEAVFTPDNDRYSGSLPLLETSDVDIKKIYDMGALGVVYFKRQSPYSVIGRTYDTLMPKYWQSVTFLWDYSLSSIVHALLDPDVMKTHLEHWMAMDIHKHFGTEWLTGGGVGSWYSVNDYAMTKISRDYLRWTGDRGWLDSKVAVEGRPIQKVIDYLESYANNWETFRTPNGLADYGGIGNLLECVSTYIHEVASLNAANVFNLRSVADIFEMLDDGERASTMRNKASELTNEVLKLYADGEGFWNARFPGGELVPVRHCYDFLTVLNTIAEDLTDKHRSEMVSFFKDHFQTPTWMRALSEEDPDAMFSVRPDHQWTGAYPAWPPMSAQGLYRIGEIDLAFEWLKGLAKSANQGPFGQAHFVETAIEPDAGGARKASPEFPYINDWTCSSNGAWVQLIIESIFGIEATLKSGISANPRFGPFDPNARLLGINYQGKLFDADSKGIHAR